MAYERAKATTRQRVYGTRSSGLSQLNETLPTLSDYCGQPCPDACVCVLTCEECVSAHVCAAVIYRASEQQLFWS